MKAPNELIRAHPRFASRIVVRSVQSEKVITVWTVYENARDAAAFLGSPVNPEDRVYRVVNLFGVVHMAELTPSQFQTYLAAEPC